MPTRRAARAFLCPPLGVLLIALVALVGCQTRTRTGCVETACTPLPCEGDRPYRECEPSDRARAERLIVLLRSRDEATFSAAARELAALGEFAVPPLLEALRSPDALTRAHAALVLGVLLDRRTIPDLIRVAAEDEDANTRCEAGRALLAMGDPRGYDPLIDALSSDDARRRTRAIDTLAETTKKTMGFEPDGPPDERRFAIRRWREWRARQQAGAMEPPPAPPEEKPTPPDERPAAPEDTPPKR